MTLLAKMAIVLKEVVTASRYGRQDELDAFLIAFLLPAFVGSLMSNALNSSFVPVYIRLKEDRSHEKGAGTAVRELLEGVSFLNLVAVAFIALATFIAGRLLLPLIAVGFNRGKMEMTMWLLVMLLPYILLSGIAALWSAALNAQERFAAVLLTPVISPLLIALLLLLFPAGGINVLAYGVLLGALIETILLGVLLRAGGLSLLPRWKGWTAPVREVLRQFLPAAAGGILMGSTLIVDQSMAAMLPGGSVAALSYGNKAVGFMLSLLATALMTFLTPYFSKRSRSSEGEGRDSLSVTLGRLLGIVFPLGLLCSLAIVAFSEPLVRLVFYRGAFTMTDIRLVAEVQTQLAWQIPFYLCAVILTRYIAAMRRNRIIFIVAGCNAAANILLNELLMWRMGVKGIALSTSLVYVLSMGLLLFFIYLSKRRDR
jgi:putative peptidoglycan lipid II flippase